MIKDVSYALSIEKYPDNYKKFLDEELTILQKLLNQRVSSAIDVGCGNGRVAPIIASKVERYVGVDTDKKCINEAQKMRKKIQNVEFYKLDGEELSKKFKENEFELSVCLWNTLAIINNQDKFLKEIYKVTKDIFFMTVIKKGTIKERREYYDSLKINYTVDENENFISKTWGSVRAYSEDEIKSLCIKAGFKIKEFGILADLSYYLILKK